MYKKYYDSTIIICDGCGCEYSLLRDGKICPECGTDYYETKYNDIEK